MRKRTTKNRFLREAADGLFSVKEVLENPLMRDLVALLEYIPDEIFEASEPNISFDINIESLSDENSLPEEHVRAFVIGICRSLYMTIKGDGNYNLSMKNVFSTYHSPEVAGYVITEMIKNIQREKSSKRKTNTGS